MPGSSCRHCGWSDMEKSVETCPECGSKVKSLGQKESIPAAAEVVAKEVKRVHVFWPGQKNNHGPGVGLGKIESTAPLKIRLDNGFVVGGNDCRWRLVTRVLILDLVKRAIAERQKIALAKVGEDFVCQNPDEIFCRVMNGEFGATDAVSFIGDDESLTVGELADMIWQYVK